MRTLTAQWVAIATVIASTPLLAACEHVYRIRMNVAGVHPAGARR